MLRLEKFITVVPVSMVVSAFFPPSLPGVDVCLQYPVHRSCSHIRDRNLIRLNDSTRTEQTPTRLTSVRSLHANYYASDPCSFYPFEPRILQKFCSTGPLRWFEMQTPRHNRGGPFDILFFFQHLLQSNCMFEWPVPEFRFLPQVT